MVQAAGVRKNFKWSFTMYKLPTSVSLGCAKEQVIHLVRAVCDKFPNLEGGVNG